MTVYSKSSVISDHLLHGIKNMSRLQINVSRRLLLVRWNCLHSGEIIYKNKMRNLGYLGKSVVTVKFPFLTFWELVIEMCAIAC